MAQKTALVEIAAAPAAYPGPANASFAFTARTLIIVNEAFAAADVVYISFDGASDDAKLVPGTPSAGLRLERQVAELWVRGVNTPSVSVLAED